jgi:hypothetical protein
VIRAVDADAVDATFEATMATVRRPRALRCSCDNCGAHVIAMAGSCTLGGSCANCGGYELSIITHEQSPLALAPA